MGEVTGIEWTNSTWSPLRVRVKSDAAAIAKAKGYTSLVKIAEKMAGHVGPHCEHVSDGCKLCYSDTNNHRCLPANGTGLPFDRRSRDLVDPFVDEKALMLPLKWREAKRIFVENQSDLFGEWVPDEQIDSAFAVMALCPHHTFQLLTKRPERMLAYLSAGTFRDALVATKAKGMHARVSPFRLPSEGIFDARRVARNEPWEIIRWPLPNVHLGVSVENQATADARIPLLLQTPAAVRFVSYEPALGLVDFEKIEFRRATWYNALEDHDGFGLLGAAHKALNWLIIGGESGPGARPFDVRWAESAVRQCEDSGTACFVKQLGAHPIAETFGGKIWTGGGRLVVKGKTTEIHLKDKKGGDMSEWPEDLRVREFPKGN